MGIFIASLLGLFILLDTFVLWRMYQLLKYVRHRLLWRTLLLAMAFLAAGFCAFRMLANSLLGSVSDPFPRWLVAGLYIWHFMILPLVGMALLADWLIRQAVRRWKRAAPASVPQPPASIFSRRHFLASMAMTVPPVATVSLAGIAMAQLGKFRVRSYDLAIPGWPGDLEGYKIAVVADVHAGAFSTQKMLNDIADSTNALRADLVLLGGDLVNISLQDLPNALDMVMRLDSRDGVYMIQGNHDVIQGPDKFDRAVRQRGVKLLVDQSATITARGVMFQLLGTRWTSDRFLDDSVAFTAGLRNPDVFAMMLAHHPHSFDTAAACGIPLVISGHTHGGQIMLTDRIGAGPLRFRYWTGRYDKPNSTLIVSNGVGNWFPLRVNAPAEILDITMHRPA